MSKSNTEIVMPFNDYITFNVEFTLVKRSHPTTLILENNFHVLSLNTGPIIVCLSAAPRFPRHEGLVHLMLLVLYVKLSI